MNEGLRIALVFDAVFPGESLGRDRLTLARGLVDLGASVDLYCLPDAAEHAPAGVRARPVWPPVRGRGRLGGALQYAGFALAATRALRARRQDYDIVDVSGTTALEHDVVRVHAVQRAERRRWPERGGRSFRGARARAALAPLLHPRIGLAGLIQARQLRPGRYRLLTAVTEEVRRDLEDLHGVPGQLIELVPYPIDLERISGAQPAGLRERAGISPDTPLALFVGHDFERKGLAEAIEALARVESVQLAVLGAGPPARYERLAGALGVGSRVHFVGSTAAPERFLAEADIFLLPTREDVWGIAAVEAMAAGVPVLTTESAGVAALVHESGAGVVVQGSPADLAGALALLAREPGRRREFGEAGRRAAVRYGADAYVESTLRAYERVLAERRA